MIRAWTIQPLNDDTGRPVSYLEPLTMDRNDLATLMRDGALDRDGARELLGLGLGESTDLVGYRWTAKRDA